MSRSVIRSLTPSRQCERYLQRCAGQRHPFALRDDLQPLLFPILSQQPQRRRQPFSTCPRQQAGGMRTVTPKVKSKAQPSMAVARQKEMQQIVGGGQIPDDLGLMQGTFIMPTGKNIPSWTGNFKARWRLEKHRLGIRLGEWFQILNYRWIAIRPRPKLHNRTAAAAGKKMHREMYEAFAAGDLSSVQGEICSGLLSSLRSRIAQRPANTHLKWTLHKYLSAPRLVSYKVGVMPGIDGRPVKNKEAQNGLVQAVIRIHSLQSLQHVRRTTIRASGRLVTKEILVDSQGRELPTDEDVEAVARRNAKETVEYFVIQKQLRKSREGDWMVWGTAEEASAEKIERSLRKTKQEKQRKKEEAKARKAQEAV